MSEAKPVRLRLSRQRGFKLQEHSRAINGLEAVNCARPGIFGNPFIHQTDASIAVDAFKRHCRGGAQSFEMGPGKLQFAKYIHKNSLHFAWSDWLNKQGRTILRGRNLACWCALDAPCHADVLLEIANRPICEGL